MPLARPFRILALSAAAAGLLALPALAQGAPDQAAPNQAASQPPAAQGPAVGVELNRLEARSEGCRVWMVVRNPGPAVDPLRLDLVVFGKDQVVARRLALDLGPLPAEKTMARIFDLAGTPCDGVGHILLNDVLACAPEAPAACLARLAVTSRAQGVALEK